MSNRDRGTCDECVFWVRDERNAKAKTIDQPHTGQCRRYPPELLMAEHERWPITTEHDWCGEWK